MPDHPSSAAKPEPTSEPTEFQFDKPASEVPRIKRRSLKTKASGLQPATSPSTARELEKEAPPLSAEEAARPATTTSATREAASAQAAPAQRTAPVAPPRTTPVASAAPAASAQRPAATTSSATTTTTPATKPAAAAGIQPSATGQKVNIALTAQQKATVSSPSTSPHGTRPATLYYTSQQPRKEATESMKPTTTASAATATSASSSNSAASATRPANSAAASASTASRPAATATTTSASRPTATNFDYRANVERQSREQKSVGSILAYFVYGLIAVFIIGAILAGYGAYTINRQLHDQSTNLSSLDDKYTAKVADINTQLKSTQETLALAQAQIGRQQDLINKEQEDLNRVIGAINDSTNALKAEKQARASETATLRARVRALEYKTAELNQPATRP